MIWFLGLSTALWCIISYLAFKVGFDRGYDKAKFIESGKCAILMTSARLAGEQKAWRDINEFINRDVLDQHSGTVN